MDIRLNSFGLKRGFFEKNDQSYYCWPMSPIMLLCLKKILRVRQIMRYKVLLFWAKLNNGILSSTSKIHIPNMGVDFLFIWKGQVFLWTESINWRILTWIWKGIIWAVYVSRSGHTTQFRTNTKKLVPR